MKNFFIKTAIKSRFEKEKTLYQIYGWKSPLIRTSNLIKKKLFFLRNNKEIIFSKNFGEIKKVLVISGCEGTAAEIHRVFHLAEWLKIADYKVKVVPHSQLSSLDLKELLSYNLVWVHRAAAEPVIDSCFVNWKKYNIPIVYDTDDLVFDKKIIPFIAAIKEWPIERIKLYEESMIKYLSLMLKSNYLSSPTDFLSKKMKEIANHKTFILRNALDTKTYNKYSNIVKEKTNKKIIGYFSGTNTHDQDFLSCAPALLKILKNNKNVVLKIVGSLALPSEFKKFPNQVITKPLVPFKELYKEYCDIDINLAPLELNNPYCESKSELKYYFAALSGIPTVATPTGSFKYCIEDGINGFLAKDSIEWEKKIDALVNNQKLYKKISNNCRNHSRNEYSPKSRALKLKDIFKEIKNEQ